MTIMCVTDFHLNAACKKVLEEEPKERFGNPLK